MNGDNPTALERTENFASCMDPEIFSGLSGCTETCAPTFGMLASSETPITEEPTNFGAGANSNDAAPNTSRCEIWKELQSSRNRYNDLQEYLFLTNIISFGH